MCLFNVKLIVIFHVGTKWFAQGKPEFMTCDASQKTEHTMKTALLGKTEKKTNFSLFVLLSKILYYVEGAVFLYTTCMAPAALFFLKIFIF